MPQPNNLFNVLWIALALLLSACGSTPPVVDCDRSDNFADYQSYAAISEHPMLSASDTGPVSPLLERRLMRIVDDKLQAKSFRKTGDPERADFTIGARDKVRVNSYPAPYRPFYGGWGWGAPYYGGYAGGSNVDVQQYTEGTLAIV